MNWNWYSLPNFVVSIYTLTLGIVVLCSNPKAAKNRACFLLACASFGWLFFYGLLYSTTNYSTALVFSKIGHLSAIIISPVVYYFLITVLGSDRKRIDLILLKIAIYAAILASILLFSSSLYFKSLIKHYWGYYPLGGPLMIAYALWTFFIATRGIYVLAGASARARNDLREDDYHRFKYYSLSLSVFMVASIDYLPKFGPNINVYPFGYVFVGAFSSLVTYAILRHKLLDVDIIIRRSFIYSALIFIITSIYLAIILIGEYFFRSYFGYASLVTAIIAASVIALAFNPLREKIQKIVDVHFFKIDPEKLAHENSRLKAVVQDQDRMKAVATLAAGMAHEIKNPLTAIKTFTEHLPSHTSDPIFMEKFTKIVGSEVSKIDSIVKQLLEFSKPSAPQLEKINIVEVIEDTLRLLEAEFVKHRIEVSKQFYSELLWINGDKKQLQQCFLNLFLNSIQAMPNGGKLSVDVSLKNQKITASVSDTGSGTSKENIPHIFDPFFTTKENGTGLGLAITHGILKEHSAKTEIKSTVGEGTIFSISFAGVK